MALGLISKGLFGGLKYLGITAAAAPVIGGGLLAADQLGNDGALTDPIIDTIERNAGPLIVKRLGGGAQRIAEEGAQVGVGAKWEAIKANIENLLLLIDKVLGGNTAVLSFANKIREVQSDKPPLSYNGKTHVETVQANPNAPVSSLTTEAQSPDGSTSTLASTLAPTSVKGFFQKAADEGSSMLRDKDGDGHRELDLDAIDRVANNVGQGVITGFARATGWVAGQATDMFMGAAGAVGFNVNREYDYSDAWSEKLGGGYKSLLQKNVPSVDMNSASFQTGDFVGGMLPGAGVVGIAGKAVGIAASTFSKSAAAGPATIATSAATTTTATTPSLLTKAAGALTNPATLIGAGTVSTVAAPAPPPPTGP